MSRILVTGFEAFGNTPVNPAEAVARALDGRRIGAASVDSCIVPNSFFVCIDAVVDAIAELQPDVVLMMGEYSGRAMVTVERFAHNFNDATRYDLLDNQGCSLQDQPTVVDGPLAYSASVPLRAMVKAMRAAGVPADISDTAGTFCCKGSLNNNYPFWGVEAPVWQGAQRGAYSLYATLCATLPGGMERRSKMGGYC